MERGTSAANVKIVYLVARPRRMLGGLVGVPTREIQEEIEFVKEDCLWDEAWPEKCSCLQCQELEQAFREWKMKYLPGGLR